MGGYILESFHIAPVHDSKLNSPDQHQSHPVYRTDCPYSKKEKKNKALELFMTDILVEEFINENCTVE